MDDVLPSLYRWPVGGGEKQEKLEENDREVSLNSIRQLDKGIKMLQFENCCEGSWGLRGGYGRGRRGRQEGGLRHVC